MTVGRYGTATAFVKAELDDAERVRLVVSPKRDDVGLHVILIILTDLRPPPFAKSSRYTLKVDVIPPEVIPVHKEVLNAP